MSVRPILLQKDGAIFGTPGAYRNSPPPIAGPYAGSELREDVTYYTVNSSGEAELKTVKAYPFYVDSVSGGLDTSGDGTLANPWRSVNYALAQIQPILACLSSKSCCTYLVLRVKGMVDYTVQYNGGSTFNGYNRFIIEPWGDDNIQMNNNGAERSIYAIIKTIFKNVTISINNDEAISSIKPVIGNCGYCIFNECNMIIENSISGYNQFSICSNYCYNSIFYGCNINANIKSTGTAFYAICFYQCFNSIFLDCEAYLSVATLIKGTAANFYAFEYNINSTFKIVIVKLVLAIVILVID